MKLMSFFFQKAAMKCLKVTSQNHPYQISRTTDSQKCCFLLVAAFKLVCSVSNFK